MRLTSKPRMDSIGLNPNNLVPGAALFHLHRFKGPMRGGRRGREDRGYGGGGGGGISYQQ